MTNEKFTPGPWWNESGVIHAKSKSWIENNHSCEHVARVYEDTDFSAEANGNLIAAAPEMYDVLKITARNIQSLIAVAGVGPFCKWLEVVEDVLKKARGEE